VNLQQIIQVGEAWRAALMFYFDAGILQRVESAKRVSVIPVWSSLRLITALIYSDRRYVLLA